MANNTLLQSLSRESVRFLIIACERFYTQSLLGGPDQSGSLNIEIPELIKLLGKRKWFSKKEFFQDVTKITGLIGIDEAQIKQVSNALYLQESKIPLEKEAVSRTVPLNIKEMTEEYERTVDEKRKAELARQIQQAQQEFQKQKIQEVLKGKTLYAETKEPLPEIQLAPKEKQALDKLTTSAQKNQKIFVAKLTRQIIENASPEIKKVIPPDQLKIAANRVALDVSDRLLNKTPVAPPEVFASLASPSANLETTISLPIAVDQVRQAGATFAVISKASDATTRLLLYPVLGKNITSTIYGSSEVTYSITTTPTENTAFTISPSVLYNDFSTFEQSPAYEALNNPAVDLAKDKLTSFGKDTLVAQLKNLPKEGPLGFISRFASSGTFEGGVSLLAGFRTEYAATNVLGKFITTFLPDYAPIIGGAAKLLNLNLGLAPVVAGATETTAVTVAAGTAKPAATIAGGAIRATLGKAVTAVAAKLGLSAVLAQIGTALGSVIPIIGNLIGLAAGWLIGKIFDWMKEHKEVVAAIGAFVLLSGIAMRSIPLMAIGVPILLGGLAFGAGPAGIAARAGFFFGRLGATLAVTIGTPIIIIIIVIPILVALILFIINSGAYLVPPSSSGPILESPYLRVDKIANPPGPFQNSDLPLTIEYTITITAKKGTLTNIHFSESCQVIKRGAPVNCPPITGEIPQPPESISPTTPFSFKYSVTYAAGTFNDSLVVNSFTVTADAAEASGVKAVGSTSIKIGNPPEDCPNNAWPIEGNGGLNEVTQGPSAPGCSHENLNNAIDIGVDGDTVVAVHSGIVTTGDDSCVGKYIKISSTCGSVPFSSLYGHLGAVSVATGQRVSVGQALGINDNTGSCTSGPHLHFEFQTSSIPGVQKPYLVRDIPVGCCSRSTCNP